jgi:stage V sporulation protein G
MCKNHLRARFCNSCGSRLDENRATRAMDGRAKLHADIAHPIHSSAREQVQTSVVRAYSEEREKAKLPGYICTYDDFDGGDFDETPMSYGAMVSEMSGKPAGFKPHPPQSAPKGTHFNTAEVPAARARAGSDDAFGDGIL